MYKESTSSNIELRVEQASALCLDKLQRLFEAYRAFYLMPAAPETSKKFLKERLDKQDSIIFIALKDYLATGFCQIYPSFSSIAMKPIWILNDLFVDENFRGLGVAKTLIMEVERRAKEKGIFSIKLATAIDNKKAQSLYIKLGYQKVSNFDHFSKRL